MAGPGCCEACQYWNDYGAGLNMSGEGTCAHIMMYYGGLYPDSEFRTPPDFWCAEYDKKEAS